MKKETKLGKALIKSLKEANNPKGLRTSKGMKAYICGTDWLHEWPEGSNFMELFATVKELKDGRLCWPQCGIVEINLIESRWVEPENFYVPIKEKRKRK